MKASKIVERALGAIQVRASEQPITASEMSTGIAYLNDLMASWASVSRAFGFTEVVNADDETAIPDWANRAVISNLAMEMAPEYGKQVTPALVRMASDSLRLLKNRLAGELEVFYPNTLPVGSANNEYDVYTYFFSNPAINFLLTDDGSSLLLSDGTPLEFDA